jgi:hypothetical protein
MHYLHVFLLRKWAGIMPALVALLSLRFRGSAVHRQLVDIGQHASQRGACNQSFERASQRLALNDCQRRKVLGQALQRACLRQCGKCGSKFGADDTTLLDNCLCLGLGACQPILEQCLGLELSFDLIFMPAST